VPNRTENSCGPKGSIRSTDLARNEVLQLIKSERYFPQIWTILHNELGWKYAEQNNDQYYVSPWAFELEGVKLMNKKLQNFEKLQLNIDYFQDKELVMKYIEHCGFCFDKDFKKVIQPKNIEKEHKFAQHTIKTKTNKSAETKVLNLIKTTTYFSQIWTILRDELGWKTAWPNFDDPYYVAPWAFEKEGVKLKNKKLLNIEKLQLNIDYFQDKEEVINYIERYGFSSNKNLVVLQS
jgi:hydroxymethylpyrimidine pyrophosphatase-like HAD family hydrolase